MRTYPNLLALLESDPRARMRFEQAPRLVRCRLLVRQWTICSEAQLTAAIREFS